MFSYEFLARKRLMWINGNNNTKTYWDAWNVREEEWRKRCEGLMTSFKSLKMKLF